MALMVWVPIALLVWGIAGMMALLGKKRGTARSLALAMAGTFPGVIVYQCVAAPIVAAILLGIHFVWKTMEPGDSTMTHNPLVIAVSLLGALSAFGITLGLSVVGFYEGWRLGWNFRRGKSFRELLAEGPTAQFVQHIMKRQAHIARNEK